MKTALFLTTAFALVAVSATAQYKSEMSEHLKRDEVPAVVQQTLERNLGNPDADGQWELFYIETTIENSHDVILTPEFYTYTYKLNGEKKEYFLKPDGSLYQIKEEATKDGRR